LPLTPGVPTVPNQTTPVQSASLAPMPVPVSANAPQPGDQVEARWLPPARPEDAPMITPATTPIEKNTLPLASGDPTVPNQTITSQTTPVQSASSLAPMPMPVSANAPQPGAQVEARWLPPARPKNAPMTAPASTVIEKDTLPLSSDPTVPNRPRLVKTIAIHTRPVQSASLAPTPVPIPDAAIGPQPSTQVAGRWLPPVPPTDPSHTIVASAEPMPIAQSPAQAAPASSEPVKLKPEKIEATNAAPKVQLAKVEPKSQIAPSTPLHADSGWLVQIGAFDREDEARQHLSTARLKLHDALATAHPLTERVQNGDKVLYRARFTGFDKVTAAAACQQLRRSDIDCIALKN
jgi:D-alanyl-D-alanine carboxypeptidase